MKKHLGILLWAAFASSLWPEIQFTPNGMVQYRLRLKILHQTPDSGDAQSALNYYNRVGYYLGGNVKVNEQVSFGFRIGNDAISTEDASFLQQKTTATWISQAWAKMDAGVASLTFGVLPVTGNGTLDLIERSLNGGTYADASQYSWPLGTNASLEGIKLGVPVLNGAFKLGVEVTQSIITKREQSLAAEPRSNPPAVMFIVNAPMRFRALTVNPEIVAIINREVNPVTEQSNHERGVGFSAGYRINEMLSLSAKGGVAMRSNAATYRNGNAAGTGDTAFFDYVGLLGGAGGALSLGPGRLMLDLIGSTMEDRRIADSQTQYFYMDLKYAFCILEAVRKHITILPRLRVYTDFLPGRTGYEIRPELILIGDF